MPWGARSTRPSTGSASTWATRPIARRCKPPARPGTRGFATGLRRGEPFLPVGGGEGATRLSRRWSEVGEIDRPVAREVRIERDVVQPALGGRPDWRQSAKRTRHPSVGPHHAQVARALGDQHAAVRKELQGPRVVEPGDDRVDGECRMLRRLRRTRLRRPRRRGRNHRRGIDTLLRNHQQRRRNDQGSQESRRSRMHGADYRR